MKKQKISTHTQKILVVGAGGIGCEVLYFLAKKGFRRFSVVDLDTVDYSNLNRQFFYDTASVDKPKALCAKAKMAQLFPDTEVDAYFADLFDAAVFDCSFFAKHVLLVSALDNRAARCYLNQVGVFLRLPVVESGSRGFLGQVCLMLPGKSACYECSDVSASRCRKKEPDTSTHTEDSSSDVEVQTSSSHEPEETNDADEVALCSIRGVPTEPRHCVFWAKEFVFGPLFSFLETLTEERLPQFLLTNAVPEDKRNSVQKESLELTAKVERAIANRKLGSSFEKDLDWHVDLLTILTNFRCRLFALPVLDSFAVKGLAGNVIEAFIVTNACIAVLVVQTIENVFQQKKCFRYWISRNDEPVKKQELSKPNPFCLICQSHVRVCRRQDMFCMILKDFIKLCLDLVCFYTEKENVNSAIISTNLIISFPNTSVIYDFVDFLETGGDLDKNVCTFIHELKEVLFFKINIFTSGETAMGYLLFK